jgi:hypothetical protein
MTDVITGRMRWCAQHGGLAPVSSFAWDRSEKSGYARVCLDCQKGSRPDMNKTPVITISCTRCGQNKPLDAFYVDNNQNAAMRARHNRQYSCKACMNQLARDRSARKRLPELVGTGLRIHVGDGLIVQNGHVAENGHAVAVAEALQSNVPDEVQSAPGFADMTVAEWFEMDTIPSVFMIDRYALVLTEEQGEKRVDILSTSGEGPGAPVDPSLARYIVRLLSGNSHGEIRGTMFY